MASLGRTSRRGIVLRGTGRLFRPGRPETLLAPCFLSVPILIFPVILLGLLLFPISEGVAGEIETGLSSTAPIRASEEERAGKTRKETLDLRPVEALDVEDGTPLRVETVDLAPSGGRTITTGSTPPRETATVAPEATERKAGTLFPEKATAPAASEEPEGGTGAPAPGETVATAAQEDNDRETQAPSTEESSAVPAPAAGAESGGPSPEETPKPDAAGETAQEGGELPPPEKVKLGFFVTSLHDFTMKSEDYKLIVWAWFHYRDKTYEPFKTTEIVNAKSFSSGSVYTSDLDGLYWGSGKFTAHMKHNWEITNYPFDTQKLRVFFEDSVLDASLLRFDPDDKHSTVDGDLGLVGWDVLGVNVEEHEKVYKTSYGDPFSDQFTHYSRETLVVTLKRRGARLLVDSLFGTYIAFVLAVFAFSVPPSAIMGKFSFLIASIFAVVGNKYTIDAKLPPTTSITLIDKVQWLTFGCVALTAIMAIVVAHSMKTPQEKLVSKVNQGVQVGMLLLYLVMNAYWIAPLV